jgi:hypothetical protein
MTRVFTIACALAVVFAIPARAADQIEKANSPTAEFHLTQPLVVGSATLTPGSYKFQCRMVGDKEYLVVTSNEDGREVARVPCHPEELTAKIGVSDFRSLRRPDGPSSLTGVRIKGEKIEHRVLVTE